MPPHPPTPPDGAPDASDAVRVRDVRALGGTSLWSDGPAVVAEVGAGADTDAARAALAACGRALGSDRLDDGGGRERADAPDAWAHAVLALALALQRAAGSATTWGAVHPGSEDDTRTVALAYDEERVGTASVRRAAELLRDAARGDVPDVADAVLALRETWERERLGDDARRVVAAAGRRGIPARRAPGEPVVQLGLGRHRARVDGTRTERTPALAADAAADPAGALDTLARYGVPVPRDAVARDADDAVEIAEDVGYPVRVRPRDARDARVGGWSAPLDDAAALRAAFDRARGERGRVRVERFVAGAAHRVLVVDGQVVAAVRPTPDRRGEDVTARLHPDNAALCAFAADVLGLDVAGIDVVTTDVGAPFRDTGAAVVAVRASPALEGYAGPAAEEAADAIVEMLFPEGTPSRVPIVAVTGTNGKTTTTRLVAHLLRARGDRVGFTTTDGVYFEDRVLMEGDMTGPMAADMILSHPRVDAAVLETARGGILRAGLGFDRCDVGVVLNVSADHLGLRGIHTVDRLADVKRVVARAVRPRGHAVLNADDDRVYAMRHDTPGRALLFSLGEGEGVARVLAHLTAGGRAVTLEASDGGEGIVLHAGARRERLIDVADVPLALGGAARFQVANALAAAAAAWALGVEPHAIAAGLRTFVPGEARTPGRMNVLAVRGATVVVDYAHNAAAMRALLEYAARVPAARRIGVLTIPGDRRDEDIREFGGLAKPLDVAVFKEHPTYRRGRAPGEIARLMTDGLAAAGGDAARVRTAMDESEAIALVLGLLRLEDLVLFVADEPAAVLAALEGAGNRPA